MFSSSGMHSLISNIAILFISFSAKNVRTSGQQSYGESNRLSVAAQNHVQRKSSIASSGGGGRKVEDFSSQKPAAVNKVSSVSKYHARTTQSMSMMQLEKNQGPNINNVQIQAYSKQKHFAIPLKGTTGIQLKKQYGTNKSN